MSRHQQSTSTFCATDAIQITQLIAMMQACRNQRGSSRMIERIRSRRTHTAISLREALDDPHLLGNVLKGKSWRAWKILLIAAMGESLDADERAIFKQFTGRDTRTQSASRRTHCNGRQKRRQVTSRSARSALLHCGSGRSQQRHWYRANVASV